MASRRGGKMPQKKKRPVFGGRDSDAVIKVDSRNPVTARKEEAAKKAAAKKDAQAKTDAAVAKRTAKQKAERDAMVSGVRKDRPMPKRPSAISLANAADPKAKRPAKPQKAPAMPKAPAPAKMGVTRGATMAAPKMSMTPDVAPPTPMGEVKKRKSPGARVGAKGRRIVRRMGGGMMKSKMGTKGGAMGGKRMPTGMKGGGTFPDLSGDGEVTQKDILMGKGVVKKQAGGMAKKGPKGYAKGGMKKGPKGYAKGGMKKGPKGYAAGGMKSKKTTKQKVRGAGIPRKGVRPAKMR